MSKNYDQYEVKITPMQETSFDDGTWFYFVDIYYHEAPLFTYEYDDPDKIKHLYALRMIESGMDMAAKYADNIIHQDMDGNHFLPKLSDLNPHLQIGSNPVGRAKNDMWFVEHDDTEVSEMTKQAGRKSANRSKNTSAMMSSSLRNRTSGHLTLTISSVATAPASISSTGFEKGESQ